MWWSAIRAAIVIVIVITHDILAVKPNSWLGQVGEVDCGGIVWGPGGNGTVIIIIIEDGGGR